MSDPSTATNELETLRQHLTATREALAASERALAEARRSTAQASAELETSRTVLDAMQGAQKHPRGIKWELRGAGETAFLFKIDEMKNEAGGGRGWMFRVNGKLGDRSLGVFPLKAGDAVLWKFEKYR